MLFGCRSYARTLLAGLFVNHDGLSEVDMLHLVESPPGHLTGQLVISSINTDGSRKKDDVSYVTGTITQHNVSLQIGESGLVGLFAGATNLIGTLTGETLALSIGAQTEVFFEVSEKQYATILAHLNETGLHLAAIHKAVAAMKGTETSDKQLNAELTQYVSWGEQRIAHTSNLRTWYSNRLSGYTRCLDLIRPLAARGVPSWQWQSCVIDVDNDAFDRNQAVEAVQGIENKNRTDITSLNAQISAERQRFPKVLGDLRTACSYADNAKKIAACLDNVKKLTPLSPWGLVDGSLVARFRQVVPQVNAAIQADVQTTSGGQSRLSSIAEQIGEIYRRARR